MYSLIFYIRREIWYNTFCEEIPMLWHYTEKKVLNKKIDSTMCKCDDHRLSNKYSLIQKICTYIFW